VIAHEYGHHARNHLPNALAWYALFTIPLAYLIAVAARRRGGMQRPEAIPLVLLVFVVFGLVTTPLQAAITRHMEMEADWTALQTTRDPQGMQSLFQRFATTGLDDPSPPTAPYLVFSDHPTLIQRIAMARAWARREGKSDR
jgi:STE24 endopeptidase